MEHIDTIRAINRDYTDVLCKEGGATQAECDAALHNYLTDPRREVPVVCYCPTCCATSGQTRQERMFASVDERISQHNNTQRSGGSNRRRHAQDQIQRQTTRRR